MLKKVMLLSLLLVSCQPPNRENSAKIQLVDVTKSEITGNYEVSTGQGEITTDEMAMSTSIEFCPNNDPIYPKIFPAFGLSTNGMIYGLFTIDGQSWLVNLKPGFYDNADTGLQCSFTITWDGLIQ